MWGGGGVCVCVCMHSLYRCGCRKERRTDREWGRETDRRSVNWGRDGGRENERAGDSVKIDKPDNNRRVNFLFLDLWLHPKSANNENLMRLLTHVPMTTCMLVATFISYEDLAARRHSTHKKLQNQTTCGGHKAVMNPYIAPGASWPQHCWRSHHYLSSQTWW